LVFRENLFFFQIEVVVVDIIFSEPTTTSNFTLPEASYAPKDQASQLEVVNEEKKTLRLLLLRLCCLRSCQVLRRRLRFLLSSQDAAVQFWVFLWVRFRKKKNRMKIKKYGFFFFYIERRRHACVHVIVFFFWITDSPKIGFFCRLERRRSGGAVFLLLLVSWLLGKTEKVFD
jgi:hypothetical protein